MPTLIFTFPGSVVCPECGYAMECHFDKPKSVAYVECRTGRIFMPNGEKQCKNYGKILVLRPTENMLEDA